MPRSSTPLRPNSKRALAFRRKLLAWYARHARDLPWRKTRDPYRVLVSEFMLQQTQVSRVTEYYPRFLERFPTLDHLARARPKAVREEWDGLGYYARASNLHALARVVSREHGGTLPADPEALVKLPGVGRYTAGAVASFAYERPVPAVDTNVARVIRRVFFGDGRRETGGRRGKRDTGHGTREERGERGKGKGERDVWELARLLVPKNGKAAWRFNQAIMELGALICVARRPRCAVCPVVAVCRTGRRLAQAAPPFVPPKCAGAAARNRRGRSVLPGDDEVILE